MFWECVCLSVCLSRCTIPAKVLNGFAEFFCVPLGKEEEVIKFGEKTQIIY